MMELLLGQEAAVNTLSLIGHHDHHDAMFTSGWQSFQI